MMRVEKEKSAAVAVASSQFYARLVAQVALVELNQGGL
jgi:hypothetical protein